MLDIAKRTASVVEASISTMATDSVEHKVYMHARGANCNDSMDGVHPLRFSAAVVFEDGTMERAWLLKGLEYGCSLDPVSQLIHDMERRRLCVPCDRGGDEANGHQVGLVSKPSVLVMVDQFGVAHAPFAQARSLLSEHGYGYVRIMVHNELGQLLTPLVSELIPQPPGTILVSHDDFH